MIRAALDPDDFFASLDREPGVSGPAAAVVLSGLPLSAVEVLYAVHATENSGPAMLSAVLMLVAPLLLWLVVAAVFQATTRLVGGRGGFSRTLRYVGWGFLPAAAVGLLKALAAADAVLSGRVAPGPYETVKAAAESTPAFTAVDSAPVFAAFLLWAGVVWTFGVRHARRLPLRDAAVAVGVPVLAVVALSVVAALG